MRADKFQNTFENHDISIVVFAHMCKNKTKWNYSLDILRQYDGLSR